MNERIQTSIRIVSAGRLLSVPTSIACELFKISIPTPAHNQQISGVLIPQPIPKINPLDHNRRPLMTLDKRDSLEHILDITMAPVLALDGGDGSDVCIISTAIMDLSQVNTYCQRQKHGPARGGRPARGPE